MNIESHEKKLKELLDFLEISIKKGLTESQSIIGFITSQGSIELISLLLHKKNLITIGTQINHLWFRSKKTMEEKFPFDFPRKNVILTLISQIEDKRDSIVYGSPKKEEELKEIIILFNKLKEIIEEELK